MLSEKKLYSVQEARELAQYLHSQGRGYEEILKGLRDIEWDFKGAHLIKEKAISVLLSLPLVEVDVNPETEVFITSTEVETLKTLEELSRKFLYLALLYSKLNNHPSGWINYERESFFKAWGFKNLPDREKASAVQKCYEKGLIEFRVMGSKFPISCYKISFRDYERDNSLYTFKAPEEFVPTYSILFEEKS